MGWAVGNNGAFLNTIDGGENWIYDSLGIYYWLTNIMFIDASVGWISAYGGLVFYTEDGGKTWIQQNKNSFKNHYAICFINADQGWVVGDLGTILHTDNGGIVGLKPANEIIQNTIKSNTYPNPFINSTTLSYELKQPEKVTLTIYDYLGKQVYHTQENQPQGKQQLIWNAESYAEGIYYYRLRVGDAVANGKMVKVR
jgi:hypothetical protein